MAVTYAWSGAFDFPIPIKRKDFSKSLVCSMDFVYLFQAFTFLCSFAHLKMTFH